jgi:transcription elongation factor GreB
VKNYMTPDGAQRLRAELERLVGVERPQAAAAPDPSEARGLLVRLDQRILRLQQSLQSAQIVTVPAPPHEQVRFGAIVTVRDRSGSQARYRIVGIDESDLDLGWVSFVSPIARALLNARLGERVRVRLPSGEEELEILAITYESSARPGCNQMAPGNSGPTLAAKAPVRRAE